jgi:hypothetical protein
MGGGPSADHDHVGAGRASLDVLVVHVNLLPDAGVSNLRSSRVVPVASA